MGQQEVYDYLRSRLLINDYSFYSNNDIYLNLNRVHSLKSIQEATKRLRKGRFIEARTINNVYKFKCRKDEI